MGAFSDGTFITNFVPIPPCNNPCSNSDECAFGEFCDSSCASSTCNGWASSYCTKCNSDGTQFAGSGACGYNQGRCEASCNADAACDELQIGESCETGMTCNGLCKCVVATEICDNEVDDDGDTKIDCADTDCVGKTGPGGVTCCQSDNDCTTVNNGMRQKCNLGDPNRNTCQWGDCYSGNPCESNYCCELLIKPSKTDPYGYGCISGPGIYSQDAAYLCTT